MIPLGFTCDIESSIRIYLRPLGTELMTSTQTWEERERSERTTVRNLARSSDEKSEKKILSKKGRDLPLPEIGYQITSHKS